MVGIGGNYGWDGTNLFNRITNNIVLNPVNITGFVPMVAALGAAGAITGVGYEYGVTFVTATGETDRVCVSNLVSPTNQRVNLSDIPVSPDIRVISRRIYRQSSGIAVIYKQLVVEIPNNIDTVYIDNIVDGALGVYMPYINTTAGLIFEGAARILAISGGVTSIGYNSMPNNTGYACTAVGNQALYSNTIGSRNTAIGVYALFSNLIGIDNVAIGVHALNDNTASFNTAIGVSACQNNTTGVSNVGIGANCLQLNTNGGYNVAIGQNALQVLNGGSNNIAIGYGSMVSSTAGNHNTALGLSSLGSNVNGWHNVALGYEAGYHETGSYHLFIDGLFRATEALGRSNSLIHGIFNAAPANQYLHLNAGHINMSYLPIAAAGLVTGDLWNNGGVINIIP